MTTYTYDNNGNITGWDNNLYAFEYTPDNQIKKASTSGITVGEYSYDYMRRRVSKKSFGLNISYLYDIFGNLLAEVDANTGEYLNEYVYLGSKPIAVYKALIQPGAGGGGPGPGTGGTGIGCASLFLAGKGDPGTLVIILIPLVGALAYSNRRSRKRLAAILIISGSAFGLVFHYSLLTTHSSLASAATSPTAQLYYYHLDHLGTPKKITDQQKAVVWDMELDPFGNEPAISSNRITNNLRFPGQYADSETGLYYNMHRYYEPRLGRYLQPDPILQHGITNFKYFLHVLKIIPELFTDYPYVANNPVILTDVLGLTWKTNWEFLVDWTLGSPEYDRFYGPNSIETQEMKQSPGAGKLRARFYAGKCKNISIGDFSYGHYEAYWETNLRPFIIGWGNTAAQVAGFDAGATINSDGTVTFTIVNYAGTKSLFFGDVTHVPNRECKSCPGGTIKQTFKWKEKINECKCQ